jgi:DNA-binding response OmpR family regulator
MRAEPSPLLPPPQVDRRPAFSSPAPAPQQDILIVASEAAAAEHAAILRREYRVVATTDVTIAIQYLNRGAAPALVMVDIDVHGRAAVDLCRVAKSLRTPATILAIASEPATVPDLLSAGCDAVLLRPFAANLLYARIGRLLRTRGQQLRIRARQADISPSRSPLADPLATTNRTWADTTCPSCSHRGSVSFEFSSHRRSWYACLACKNVWIAKRQE